MTERLERITCPECGRSVGGYVPRRGDGTRLRPCRHNRPGGKTCRGIYALVDPTEKPRPIDLMARLEASLGRGGGGER